MLNFHGYSEMSKYCLVFQSPKLLCTRGHRFIVIRMHFNLHVCIFFWQDPNCLSRRVRSSLHPAYLKGNHLALQVEVQACSTYRTLTMPISICIGLKSFQNGQISLLWYGVVNGIWPSNTIFAHAAALR